MCVLHMPNTCDVKDRSVFVTSGKGSVSACSHTHLNTLPASCAHCFQTSCHRPVARHILQLWCHGCETGKLSVFASVFSPSCSQTQTHTRSDIAQQWPHRGPESSYFVMSELTLGSQRNTCWLIDCRWCNPYLSCTGFNRGLRYKNQLSLRQKASDKHIIMQATRHKPSVFTCEE